MTADPPAGSSASSRPASGAAPSAGAGPRGTGAVISVKAAGADDDIPPELVIDAARDGLKYLAKRAKESRIAHDQQVAKLQDKIAQIQRLLDAGKYDEAEIRLVDIHWDPIEPGTNGDNLLVRQYDEKRAALIAFLNRKRQAVSRPQ